jgi:hypothetical protein
MKVRREWHVLMLLAWIAGTGCTTLREIPRAEYVEQVPRRPIRVVLREGPSYELDAAKVEADTLVGYRRRDVEGPIDEFDTVRLPLDQVVTISARRIDWYRTGLVGGLSMAAIVAVAINRHSAGGTASPTSDCRKDCP